MPSPGPHAARNGRVTRAAFLTPGRQAEAGVLSTLHRAGWSRARRQWGPLRAGGPGPERDPVVSRGHVWAESVSWDSLGTRCSPPARARRLADLLSEATAAAVRPGPGRVPWLVTALGFARALQSHRGGPGKSLGCRRRRFPEQRHGGPLAWPQGPCPVCCRPVRSWSPAGRTRVCVQPGPGTARPVPRGRRAPYTCSAHGAWPCLCGDTPATSRTLREGSRGGASVDVRWGRLPCPHGTALGLLRR